MLLGLAAIVALFTALWLASLALRNSSIVDMWWGLGLLGAATGGYLALIGPALITFLLIRVSGVALLEQTRVRTKPGYAEYIARTSSFFPMVPR